ncbi:MAG: glycosylase [Oleiphilus sp.]|nr:MAG: glycosylase [Oleiphilus sp.]
MKIQGNELSWEKIGKVFDPTLAGKGRPWLKEFAQAPATLVFEDFVRVYFSCRPHPDENGQYCSYSAYVDFDRRDLTRVLRVSERPILPLGRVGEFDEFGTYPVSVIRKDSQVIAYYAGWTRCESVPFNTAIGIAISKDGGETFTKGGPGPVISYSPDEPFVMSGPKIRIFNGTYYLFYIAGRKWVLDNGRPEPVYKIRMASSDDGITWRKYNTDIVESVIEDDEAQASPDVYFDGHTYHMFFCYRYSKDYRCHAKGYRIGYASSENLIDWKRDDSRVGIDVSGQGWDSEMISYPHVFKLDDQVYMYYLGNQVGRYGFGLAKLKSTFVGGME